MKIVSTLLFAVLLLVAAPADAREFKGVKMNDTTTADGQELTLKGMGLRTKWFMNIYVIGFYMADPAKEPTADQARQVRLVMLRDLSAKQVGDAIRDGFEKNSKAELPKLKERLDKLLAALADVKKGESFVATYIPGKGTAFHANNKELILIEGADFGDALFKVWLGKDPVDDGLKAALLGK